GRLGHLEHGVRQVAGEEEEPEVAGTENEPLPQYKVGLFRAAAARANYLALKIPDFSCSATDLYRRMSELRHVDLGVFLASLSVFVG
ncbi:MAG: hypothetical protein ACKPKO_24775, partial [Candidatus Fonsibacter sp.]